MLARDYQARDMSYVDKEYRTDGIGDLAEFFKFDLARICARAAHDHLRLYDLRDFHHFVVVYASVKLYAELNPADALIRIYKDKEMTQEVEFSGTSGKLNPGLYTIIKLLRKAIMIRREDLQLH